MPIYEFRCAACGHVQEMLFTSSSREVEMRCGACGAEELERILSRTSHTMGSGKADASPAPSATTRTCGPGKSCTSIELPGHSRD